MLPQPAMGQVTPADGAGFSNSFTCSGVSLAGGVSVKVGVEVFEVAIVSGAAAA